MGITRRLGLLTGSLLIAFWLQTTPAAAATWEILCGGAAAKDDRFPADAEILRAAQVSEQRLRDTADRTDRLDDVFALLELPASTAAQPAVEALARYCSAAGEAMRRSPEGSQYQAQRYLMTAYRQAAGAGLDPVTSRAAFRFGLGSVASPIGAGLRGTERGRRRGSEFVAEEARQAQLVEDDSCATLAAANLEAASNTYLSALALQCAATAATRSGDWALSAAASLRLARLGLAWSETLPDEAEELRRHGVDTALSAVTVAARVQDPLLREELLGRLMGTAIDLGGGRDPRLRPAMEAIRLGRPGESYLTGLPYALQARLALLDGRSAEARSLLGEALLVESQAPLPARVPEYYLLMAAADPQNRQRHVFAAYAALENMRPLLPRLDPLTEESSFALYMRPVFESAAEVQLASAADGAESQVRAAQEIIETFRQAELQSAVGSECLPPREPLRPEALRRGEIVLYPILLPDRIELLYLSGTEAAQGKARYRRLPPNLSANRRDVTRLVEALVLSLSSREDERWQAPARHLYQLLIAPIEGRIEPDSMLVVIPDGPLRALPFAALIASDGQFLIQKTRLGVAPALAYLQPGTSERQGPINVVAASLQQRVNLPAGRFPPLAGTAAEAKVAADSGKPGLYLPDFRKADLVAALARGNVDVLHLATHASFNGRADRAFIVANEEVIRLPELREIIERNRARGDALDLLVLSACETAVGDDQASMGLAGATVQAGALSAIASLWQVDDLGTSALMREFYAHYRRGRSRSEAIRDAQLALLQGGGDNARPRIWGAFELLGAWR